MKKTCLFVLLIILLLSACQPVITTADLKPTVFETPWEDRSIFMNGLTSGSQGILGELQGATTYHIRLDLDPGLTRLTGVEEVRYQNRTSETMISDLQLRLYANILGGSCTPSIVQINGETVTPQFSLGNSLMTLPLASPLGPGEAAIIHIEFSGTIPTSMDTNYGILVYYGGTLALAHFYPMMAVFEDDGWKAELPPQQGDIISNETSFYVVSVTAPSDLVLVTSGSEVEKSVSGKLQQVVFAAGPGRDFYLTASPDFSRTTQKVGEITLNSYAPNLSQAGSQLVLDTVSAALEEFERLFAPYPYTELDVAAIPTLALGIEYPGLIAMNQDLYDLSADLNGTPMNILLEASTAHEVAHQWFYNLVGNDQVDEPWLDESLAQYVTWQYYINRYGQSGGDGFESSLQGRWERVSEQPIPIGLPVSEYHDREYGAIVYGRGAFFFEVLNQTMGQAAYDSFMKNYTNSYSWEIATTANFKSMAETECSCDLTSLFEEWVYP